MLVLTRRQNETIRFPELDITIEIIQTKASTTRVGIDAPMEIKVLRGEMKDDQSEPSVAKKILVSEQSEHARRNQLNSLSIAIGFAQKLIESGKVNLAAEKLDKALQSLGSSDAEPSACTALLVEDAENEREMLAGFLRLHGYNVQTVADGVEALDYLQDNDKPELILMDMRMPRLDGASTIRQIRENPAFDSIKIFAISGETPERANVDVKRDRVADWFQKPLEPGRLVAAINNHLSMTACSTLGVGSCV